MPGKSTSKLKALIWQGKVTGIEEEKYPFCYLVESLDNGGPSRFKYASLEVLKFFETALNLFWRLH
jgi:hypothetical protein